MFSKPDCPASKVIIVSHQILIATFTYLLFFLTTLLVGSYLSMLNLFTEKATCLNINFRKKAKSFLLRYDLTSYFAIFRIRLGDFITYYLRPGVSPLWRVPNFLDLKVKKFLNLIVSNFLIFIVKTTVLTVV